MRELGAVAQVRPCDVHGHFSLTYSARFGYGLPRDLPVPIEDVGNERERPLLEDCSRPVALLSLRYTEKGRQVLKFLISEGFHLYVQWINPGFTDKNLESDSLGIQALVQSAGGGFLQEDGERKTLELASGRFMISSIRGPHPRD